MPLKKTCYFNKNNFSSNIKFCELLCVVLKNAKDSPKNFMLVTVNLSKNVL